MNATALPKTKHRKAPEASPGLVWRTKASSRHLLMATVYSLGIAAASGLVLTLPLKNEHLTLIALAAHLTSGFLTLVFFVPFFLTHLKDGRESIWNLFLPWRLLHRIYRDETLYHRLLGYTLMWCLWLAFATGLTIAAPAVAYLSGDPFTLLPYGGHALILWAHRGVSLLLLIFLILHFPKKALS